MSEGKVYNFYNGSQNVEHIDHQENHYNYYGNTPQEEKAPTQMPPYLTREEAMDLYRFLTTNSYIDQATSPEHFLYLMGVTMSAPNKLKPINWLQTVQQLREMLTLAFEEPIKRGAIKLADIEKRAPECFLNKGAKMNSLAKSREENSNELDELRNFFRPEQKQ